MPTFKTERAKIEIKTDFNPSVLKHGIPDLKINQA